MTTTVAHGHPVATHHIRNAAVGVTLFTAACGGLYTGAQAVTRHYQQPTSNVSYADQSTITRTLQGAWHTPATAGDFIPTASIQTADVVSVVKVAN